MNYSCLSCRAKYVIPDARVAAAGADGLRVRCTSCRAIMAVTGSMAQPTATKTSTKTSSSSRARSAGASVAADNTMRAQVESAAPTTPLITGVMVNPFANVALPAGVGSGGGGSREVTGIFLPLLSSVEEKRDGVAHFYAAIAGRSRGPFTARELVMLADKGKIRAGTLLWRPGASGWKPLKHITEFDVAFVKDAVIRRKLREQEAESAALRRRGITPIRLERRTVSMPPLPADAAAGDRWDEALHDAAPIPLHGEASGFEWRAPEAPSVVTKRQRQRFRVEAVAAVVVTGAAVAAAAWFLLT